MPAARPRLATAFALGSLLSLAACNGRSADDASPNTMMGDNIAFNNIAMDSNTGSPAMGQMTLTSSAFNDGGDIPQVYSCDGKGVSPPLAWSGLPEGTQSLVVAIDDPDAKSAPGGVFRHWGAYDIPASMNMLPEGAGSANPSGFKQVQNDKPSPGYTGMCPPKGDPAHHYHFRLIALDTASLDIKDGASIKDLEDAAQAHKLGETELVGMFKRG